MTIYRDIFPFPSYKIYKPFHKELTLKVVFIKNIYLQNIKNRTFELFHISQIFCTMHIE